MDLVASMIETHPNSQDRGRDDISLLRDAIVAAYECAQICTGCADACLSEREVDHLSACIRLDLDCAEICVVTGSLLSRIGLAGEELLRAQLRACQLACAACETECLKHADAHEHCAVCAQACRTCREACTRLLEASPKPHGFGDPRATH
jgi:hypothetical protein